MGKELLHSRSSRPEDKIFIGVAWPYVNGDLHIGHLAGYLMPADIFARYSRSTGREVLMVSGSDCYGTPVTVEADKARKTPREIAETYHRKDVNLFGNILNLSYDIYTKTDSENHIRVVQDFFINLLSKGYIYVDTTKQYYSEKEKRFLPDRYVEGTCKNCGFNEARSDQCDSCGKVLNQEDLANPISKLTKSPVELRETEHYFLDWPKLQPFIERYVRQYGPSWKNWIYQESLGWLRQGLKPRAITRDIDWGIPIPVDRMPKKFVIENTQHKRLYVWFEAVIGYFSASQLWAEETGGSWESFWNNPKARHYYFMGKDNLPFHTMFWPGQLHAYDPSLHLPDKQSINMFLNFDGRQFSKSRGVSIPIEDIVKKYGRDPVRFYLTMIMPELKDSSFNWQEFIAKNNDILVGNLGNFVHRTLSLGFETDIRKIVAAGMAKETQNVIETSFLKSKNYLSNCEFRNYLDTVLKLSGYANKYIDYEKIWILKKKNSDRFAYTLNQLYSIILSLGVLSGPLFPDSSRKIFEMLDLPYNPWWPKQGHEAEYAQLLLQSVNTRIKPTPLFRKIDTVVDTHQ